MDALIAYFPFIVIASLLLVERYQKLFSATGLNGRDAVNLSLGVTSIAIKYFFSTYLLLAYVNFWAPFQVLSISNLEWPNWTIFILGFLVLDMAEYWSHRIQHMVSPLWRLHRLYHSDKQVDVLTTFLHHPLEVVFSIAFITAILVLFDIPLIVIISYGLTVGFFGALSHTTLLFGNVWNRWLSMIFVTPNFHKIHHSLDYAESNSNYGLVFSFWDRLFGSCRTKERELLLAQINGLDTRQTPGKVSFLCYIINPIKKSRGS